MSPDPYRTAREATKAFGTLAQGSGTVASFGLPSDPYPFLGPPDQSDDLGTLGSYRVKAELGKGGMGVVFRAEDAKLRRQVAVKVMLPEVAADPMARDRFVREARAQAAIDHDHVAAIYQVDDGPTPYLVMPLLRGRPLSVALTDDPRPPLAEVCRIGQQIADGLAAAHARGLIHRDIKPGNIWLEGDRRRVKILDFGLARASTDVDTGDQPAPLGSLAAIDLTRYGAIVGTPAYMPPEQAAGQPVDHRADLWSLGVILFQMATGELPFGGATVGEVLSNVMAAELPDLPGVPTPLAALVRRLLSKDPTARPASAAEVANALHAIAADAPTLHAVSARHSMSDVWADVATVDVEPETQPYNRATKPPARGSRKSLAVVWGLLAAVVCALAGGLVYQVFIKTPRGTLVIDSSDPDVEVRVTKSGAVLIDKTKQREFALEVGKYGIELAEKKDGLRLTTDKFEITRDGKTTVTVRLERPKPKDSPAPPSDPDRTAAEQLKPFARITVRTADGKDTSIGRDDPLPDGPFTLTGLGHFGPLPDDFMPVTLLPAIERLDGLTRIDDLNTPVSAADLDRLLAATVAARLEWLHAHRLPLTRETADRLVRFPALTAVGVQVTADTPPAALDQLADLPTLRGLRLVADDPPPADLPLGRLATGPIHGLALRGWQAFPPGLMAAVARMPNLIDLDLAACRPSDADIAALAVAPKLRAMHWTPGPLTPAWAASLGNIRTLRYLHRADPNHADDTGLADLVAANPRLAVHWANSDKVIQPPPPDRAAVLQLQPHVTFLTIQPSAGPARTLKPTDPIPDEPFTLTGLDFFNATPPPEFVSDILLPAVEELTGLTVFDGLNLPLSDAEFARLAAAPFAGRLRILYAFRTPFRPTVLAALPRFPKLVSLSLRVTADSPPAAGDALADLPDLRRLFLYADGPPPTEFQLGRLADRPVRELLLRNWKAFPPGLTADIARMPDLVMLDVSHCGVSDADLAALASAPKLQAIYFLVGPLTPERVKILAGIRTLRHVEGFDGSAETIANANALAAALPGCRVRYDGGEVAPTDPDRAAAEALLPHVDWLKVRRADGQEITLRSDGKLPDEPFVVIGMSFYGRNELPDTFVSDTLVPALARLKELRMLMAVVKPVTAADMAVLAAAPFAPDLEQMALWHPTFPAAGFDPLPRFPKLEAVYVGASDLTADRIELFHRLPRLHTLGLIGTPPPGTDYTRLAALPLRTLWVRSNEKAPVDLFTAIGRMPELDTLDLFNTRVPDDRLAGLAGAVKLRSIYGLSGPLTAKRVDRLAALPTLRQLVLTNAGPDAATRAKELAARLPACRIEFDGQVIEPTAK